MTAGTGRMLMTADPDDAALERARQRLRRATRHLRCYGRLYPPGRLRLLRYVAALSYADLRAAGLRASAELIVRAGRR